MPVLGNLDLSKTTAKNFYWGRFSMCNAFWLKHPKNYIKTYWVACLTGNHFTSLLLIVCWVRIAHYPFKSCAIACSVQVLGQGLCKPMKWTKPKSHLCDVCMSCMLHGLIILGSDLSLFWHPFAWTDTKNTPTDLPPPVLSWEGDRNLKFYLKFYWF